MPQILPSLPHRDPDSEGRRAALDRARAAYAYRHRGGGLVFPEKLPEAEAFDAVYGAHVAEAKAAELVNRVASAALGVFPAESTGPYDDLFATLPRAQSMSVWREDWAFAWQRVAGVNPAWIRGLRALPENFPVTDAHLARSLAGDSLDAALAERRLYLCDYACLDGLTPGTHQGRTKFVCAPLALFAVPRGRRDLVPIAIQEGQRPGPESPIYTPADGVRWQIARLAVQTADANVLGTVVHIGYCHMIAQRIILAAHTCLSERHPLLALWQHHFRYTLAVNQTSIHTIFGPGGKMDELHGPTLAAQLAVHQRALEESEWDDLHPERDAERRGVADTSALPVYPVRDDGLLAWRALHGFCSAYVRLYYRSAADVAADAEIHALARAIGDREGGNLPRLAAGIRLATIDDVADLAARVIFRVSTYHAPINHGGYDWLGYAPNMPSSCAAPPPPSGREATFADYLAMLPPLEIARGTLEQEHLLIRLILKGHRLGEYPEDAFADPRVGELCEVFRTELAGVESRIIARNATRPLPFTWLLPSRTTTSIAS